MRHVALMVPARQCRARPGRARRRRSTAAPRGGSPSWADRSRGPCPAGSCSLALWKKKSPKSNSPPGTGRAVDEQVPLDQVPAPRPHQQDGRRALSSAYRLPVSGAVNAIVPPHRVARLSWPSTRLSQVGLVGVLEVGHEHARARVEGVDDHLSFRRTRDLDAAVEQVGRAAAPPSSRRRARRPSPARKFGRSPASKRACRSRGGPGAHPRAAEGADEVGDEGERFGGSTACNPAALAPVLTHGRVWAPDTSSLPHQRLQLGTVSNSVKPTESRGK